MALKSSYLNREKFAIRASIKHLLKAHLKVLCFMGAIVPFSNGAMALDHKESREGSWLVRPLEIFRSKDDDLYRPVPPAELTKKPSKQNFRAGRIIVAQSKKQLGQNIADNGLRIDQLEDEVRRLNGRIEELIFEIQRMNEGIRLMQEDNEFRFQELEGGGKRSDTGVNSNSQQAQNPPVQAGTEVNQAATGNDLVPRNQEASDIASQGNQPLDLGAAVRRPADTLSGVESRDPLLQPNGIASLGTLSVSADQDPEGLYNLGYSQLLNGDYDLAEVSLRQFTEAYPDHGLAPNAQYWLAETFFARGFFDSAASEFSNSYKTFPNSPKAPDSLLKLGLSFAYLNESEAACATLAEMFIRFPNASRSIQSAAREQQARSNCTG